MLHHRVGASVITWDTVARLAANQARERPRMREGGRPGADSMGVRSNAHALAGTKDGHG